MEVIKKMKSWILILLALILFGGFYLGGTMIMNHINPYYSEWPIAFTADELQELFWAHDEAFDYIEQVVRNLDYENFTIVISSKKKGNLLFYVRDDGKEKFVNGSEFGYEKDELFEQYVYELLVDEKLTKIDVTKGSRRLSFGYNSPIYYAEGRAAIPKTEMSGSLKENWFYYIQSYV